MSEPQASVYGGVDTHADVHVAAAITDTGVLIATKGFPTSPLGLRRLASWLEAHGPVARVGVEGTGTYGLGLQRVLQARGVEVVEVNRPNRQLRRSRGKSDPVDAEAAARAVLAGHATAVPKRRDGIVEAIRVLRVALQSSRAQRTRVIAQFQHLLLTAPDPLRVDFTGRSQTDRVTRAASLRPGPDLSDVTAATKTALRVLARQYQTLTEDLKKLRRELDHLTATANPTLRQVPGVGPDTAATLLVAAGDNTDRLANQAAFTALCGASPVEASSGKVRHHRLNRGGDRQANAALYRIVIVRMSSDPATRAYVAKRTAEGKSKRAIIRCLKRYVARQLYTVLTNPAPAEVIHDLRPRRTALHLPMQHAATDLGIDIMTISRLERGTHLHQPTLTRYRSWLHDQEQQAQTA